MFVGIVVPAKTCKLRHKLRCAIVILLDELRHHEPNGSGHLKSTGQYDFAHHHRPSVVCIKAVATLAYN